MTRSLLFQPPFRHGNGMGLPKEPLNLNPQQIDELNAKFSKLRHDINGDLAILVAAAELIKLNAAIKELIRHDPEGTVANMLKKLINQPPMLRDRITKFSAEFEKSLRITRP
jgi:hypothetical protein